MAEQGGALVVGAYRYWLLRRWAAGSLVTWVMLNPSTADASVDDPTINRCRAFSRRWGYAGLLVVNLYAFRATAPSELRRVPDPVGPDNDAWLRRALRAAAEADSPVVAAWGAMAAPERVQLALSLPGAERLLALQVNKDGSPGHPLYLRSDCELRPFREVARAGT